MLRRRRSTLKSVKELDAFPKVPESYTKNSSTGGTISIVCFVVITVFVISEIIYFKNSDYKFQYGVDTDLDSKLKINVDLTIAMPCSAIGADILDVTNQNAQTYGTLEEHDAFYELTNEQKELWEHQRKINRHIRKEYHSLHELIWRSGAPKMIYRVNEESNRHRLPDACRLSGSLTVNKVSGNFHITAGKLLPSFGVHAHLSMFLRDTDYNFSHRIESLSFGDQVVGLFNPLDGDEKIAQNHFQIYTYYIKVVPTEVDTSSTKMKTFQYSVTEQARVVNHHKGSHGIPGIFFKYDMSSVKVKIIETRQPLWQFLVRLCAVVGGVFATAGIINGIIGLITEILGNNFKNGSNVNEVGQVNGIAHRTLLREDSNEVFSTVSSSNSTSSVSNIDSNSSSLPSVEELDDSVISLS